MATDRQHKANRQNAQASTGPRTEQGKDRAKYNALRHGLCAQDVLLPDEDPDAFEDLYTALVNEPVIRITFNPTKRILGSSCM